MNRRASYVALLMGACVLTICAPLQQKDTHSDTFVVTGHSAGAVRIGMSVDELKTVANQERANLTDLNLEGSFSPAVLIGIEDSQKRSLVAQITMDGAHTWVVWRIQVYDARFHTLSGIHVGSSYGELKAKHPDIRIVHEEGNRAAIDRQASITFMLSSTEPLSSCRVESLLLTGTRQTTSLPRHFLRKRGK